MTKNDSFVFLDSLALYGREQFRHSSKYFHWCVSGLEQHIIQVCIELFLLLIFYFA